MRTGLPMQFIRFAGCNLRCPGWPCDTQHAIEPSLYQGKFENITPEELAERADVYPRAFCLTGGEPFLQPRDQIVDLLHHLAIRGPVDVFTNGTFPIPPKFHGTRLFDVQYMLDWKLPGSGEVLSPSSINIRWENAKALSPFSGIKFVVTGEDDLLQAKKDYIILKDHTQAQFWAAPAFNRISPEQVVNFILTHELPWRLNLQTHKFIWDPERTLV